MEFKPVTVDKQNLLQIDELSEYSEEVDEGT
jgi:hypothetical protein